jgi:hypothetical protein
METDVENEPCDLIAFEILEKIERSGDGSSSTEYVQLETRLTRAGPSLLW